MTVTCLNLNKSSILYAHLSNGSKTVPENETKKQNKTDMIMNMEKEWQLEV